MSGVRLESQPFEGELNVTDCGSPLYGLTRIEIRTWPVGIQAPGRQCRRLLGWLFVGSAEVNRCVGLRQIGVRHLGAGDALSCIGLRVPVGRKRTKSETLLQPASGNAENWRNGSIRSTNRTHMSGGDGSVEF